MQSLRFIVQRVSQLPGLRNPIRRLWNTYEHVKFEYYVRKNTHKQRRKAVIDPYELYSVSPEIVKSPSIHSFDFITDTGKVIGGEWDTSLTSITDERYYTSFEQYFNKESLWEETALYSGYADSIAEGDYNRYSSLEELEEKFQLYERMYREFAAGRYQLQSDLAGDQTNELPGHGGRALFPTLTDSSLIRHEIALNIGRDGTFIRNDGRHRLALAALAGLDEIPVRIVVRHEQWQSLRDEIARGIDAAIEEGIPKDEVKSHVQAEFTQDLDRVDQGLSHPDLAVIFERRLADA